MNQHARSWLGLSAAAVLSLTGLAAPLAAGGVIALAAAPALGQAAEQITEQNFIAGSMDIDFGTRTNLDRSGDLKEGSAAIGAKDTYKFQINVAKTTEFAGSITRQPNLYTKNLGRRKQDAQLAFDVNLSVLNPKDIKQKKTVGKWVGLVPIDTASGAFDLAGGRSAERPLRMAIDTVGKQAGFTRHVPRKLVGKAEKKDSLAAYTFKRVVGDKTYTINVKVKNRPDALREHRPGQGPERELPELRRHRPARLRLRHGQLVHRRDPLQATPWTGRRSRTS
jgi:hypothetical protein